MCGSMVDIQSMIAENRREKEKEKKKKKKLECGPMPKVMAALPNIGGARCPTLQSLADVERRRCSNEAKTRNPLKFVGVPQTHHQSSAACRQKFTILTGHMGEMLLFNNLFLRLSIRALVAKIWPDKVV